MRQQARVRRKLPQVRLDQLKYPDHAIPPPPARPPPKHYQTSTMEWLSLGEPPPPSLVPDRATSSHDELSVARLRPCPAPTSAPPAPVALEASPAGSSGDAPNATVVAPLVLPPATLPPASASLVIPAAQEVPSCRWYHCPLCTLPPATLPPCRFHHDWADSPRFMLPWSYRD